MKNKVSMISSVILFISISCGCESNIEPVEIYEPEIIWSYKLQEQISFDDDVMPIIENGYTYVAARRTLTKVELKSGNKVWESLLGIDVNRAIQSKKLLHSDHLLFLNHSNWVKAYNKENGKLVWECIINNFENVDLSIMSQDQNSLVLGGRGEFVKIDKFSGKEELRVSLTQLLAGGEKQSARNPVISPIDNYIYVPTGYNTSEGLKGNLLCYNSISGEFLWGFPGNVSNNNPETCAIQDTFLVFVIGNVFFALNRFTGKKIWETEIKNDGFWSSVIIDNETIYMGSAAESRMYALDLNNGNLKWKSENTQSSIITIPTVIDNRIYFSNWAYIYVLNTKDGSTMWKSLPPEYKEDNSYRYISSVSVSEGYMVCIGNKKVYCLTDPWY